MHPPSSGECWPGPLEPEHTGREQAVGVERPLDAPHRVDPLITVEAPDQLLFDRIAADAVLGAWRSAERDGSLANGKLFADMSAVTGTGNPDGMKFDAKGNLYSVGPGGIWVHNPDGSVVGRLKTPGHHPTNMCFGDDDWKSMYITMIGSVVRIRLNTAGVPSLH